MTEPREDDDILAAELALGLLDEAERQTARERAARDPDFAGSVRSWEARLSHMADLPPVDVPSSVKSALMAELFPATKKHPLWARIGFWQVLTGGAMAAVLILALALPTLRDTPAWGPLYTAEIASDIGDFRVVAVVDKARDEVILTRTAGAAPDGRILQVWAHGPDEPAESVGLWPSGESVRLPLPANIAAVRGTLTLGVSEEPPGGSTTGSPSGRVFGTVDIPNIVPG